MQAPLAYVTPTPNMIIKQGHPYVDPSGQVRTPSLTNWLYPSSDLSMMSQEMAMLFGVEPPLYSKPPGYVPPPVQAQQPPNSNQSYVGVSSYNPMMQHPHQQPQQQPSPYLSSGSMPQPGPVSAASPSTTAMQSGQYDPALAGYSLWGGAYAASHADISPGASRPGVATAGPATASPGTLPGNLYTTTSVSAASPAAAEPPQAAQESVKDTLQAAFQELSPHALQVRLQAALEAYNRHATGEMDRLLEVQRTLVQRDQDLQRLVRPCTGALCVMEVLVL